MGTFVKNLVVCSIIEVAVLWWLCFIVPMLLNISLHSFEIVHHEKTSEQTHDLWCCSCQDRSLPVLLFAKVRTSCTQTSTFTWEFLGFRPCQR